jgi:hypothetical protein
MSDMIERVAKTVRPTTGRSERLDLCFRFYPGNEGTWVNTPQGEAFFARTDEELVSKIAAILKRAREEVEKNYAEESRAGS